MSATLACFACHSSSPPTCKVIVDAGLPITTSDGGRTFPSLFAAWSLAESLNKIPDGGESPLCETNNDIYARHDLVWRGWAAWGLKSADGSTQGETTSFSAESIQAARANANALRALNPNIRLLAEIRYHDAQTGYLPADSPWWLRDSEGNLVPTGPGSDSGYYELNFHDATLQAQVGNLCALVMQTGALDGCFLDWWNGYTTDGGSVADRTAIATNVRAALGDSGLLVANVNGTFPPASTAPYINGLYMEGYGSSFFPLSSWQTAASIMLFAVNGAGNLHSPSFSAFEGWYPQPSSGDSIAGRDDYSLVRWTTALALVFSDGYVLFGDPDGYPGGDHNHDLYVPLWSDAEGNHPLGVPIGPPVPLDAAEADGTFRREYTKGTVVLNPPGGGVVTVSFASPMRSLGTGIVGTMFELATTDGDEFVSAP